jgi:hypothetical protein
MIGCQGARHYRPSHGTDKIRQEQAQLQVFLWRESGEKKILEREKFKQPS